MSSSGPRPRQLLAEVRYSGAPDSQRVIILSSSSKKEAGSVMKAKRQVLNRSSPFDVKGRQGACNE